MTESLGFSQRKEARILIRISGLKPIFLVVLLFFSGQEVKAQTPLKDVTYISEGLIAAGMAIEIHNNCERVNVRLFRGLSFLNGLKRHAVNLGYSEGQIDAYINDFKEKSRLEEIVRKRLADLGVVSGKTETYCLVGIEQIAEKTTLGSLLH